MIYLCVSLLSSQLPCEVGLAEKQVNSKVHAVNSKAEMEFRDRIEIFPIVLQVTIMSHWLHNIRLFNYHQQFFLGHNFAATQPRPSDA